MHINVNITFQHHPKDKYPFHIYHVASSIQWDTTIINHNHKMAILSISREMELLEMERILFPIPVAANNSMGTLDNF
jgi:5-formaminoimidazole-4-carboxamide-1-beta-D-ribofuranosyl 5'-monophosphate synthetase